MNSPLRLSGLSIAVALSLLAHSPASRADAAPAAAGTVPTDNAGGRCSGEQKPAAPPKTDTVTIETVVNGKKVNQQITYTVTVGYLQVSVNPATFAGLQLTSGGNPADVAQEPYVGCFFYTWYKVDPGTGPARPLTFAFNGGPGSASLWLHLGLMGPQRLQSSPDGLDYTNPPVLVNNPYSPLDKTDVVMIDPVGTGYSHAKQKNGVPPDNTPFFSAIDDAESVATFIKTFVQANPAYFLSPKYVLGESYGGVRGSLVAQILPSSSPEMFIRGTIFISPCLSTSMTDFQPGGVAYAYPSFLPTMAEVARAQGRINPKDKNGNPLSNEALFKETFKFAWTDLFEALTFGTLLSPDGGTAEDDYYGLDPTHDLYKRVQQKLSDYTGMPLDHFGNVNANGRGDNLHLMDQDFFSSLKPGDQVGRYDGRFAGGLTSNQSGYTAEDPSDSAMTGVFVPGINYYLHELGMTSKRPYDDMANIQYWSMSSDATEFDGSQNLSNALVTMNRNGHDDYHIFFAGGYFDLACPISGVEWERGQIDRRANDLSTSSLTAAGGHGRTVARRYDSGHMIYINPTAAGKLHADLDTFYDATYYNENPPKNVEKP